MKRIAALLSFVLLFSAILTGCKQEEDRSVTISGRVDYADYTSGVIVIHLCESESSYYEGSSLVVQTPGNCVAETTLLEPGDFSLDATVTWAETEPELQLLAYLVPTAETELHECEAGAFISMSADDDDDVVVNLEAGQCVMRD